uniref:Uncharacterized protein n=1 Tax=Oryza meridionalis TaxID=40149 RepID=A0A0E0C7K1_9ORYZ
MGILLCCRRPSCWQSSAAGKVGTTSYILLLIPSDEMMFSNNKMCKTMLSFETLEADIKKTKPRNAKDCNSGGRLDEHGAADGDGNLSGRRSNSGCAEVGGQTAAEERGEIQRAAAIAAQGQIRRAQAGSGRPAATPSVSSLLGPPLRSAPRGRRDREAPVDGDLHEDDCEGE